MNSKTILFLNLRFSDFYSPDLFKKIKEDDAIRLAAIVDQQFSNKIGNHIRNYLDEIYYVHSKEKDGFLAEFNVDAIRPIVEYEKSKTQELRIVCTDEFNLLVAGQLRQESGLSGHADDILLPYRDKVLMKSIVALKRLRVPRYISITADTTYIDIVSKVGSPFVLKPTDSCGSHGVCIIYQSEDYEAIRHVFKRQSNNIEAEEYISGQLYHVDSLIQDNEIKFICASEYTYPNFEFTQGKPLGSIPMDSKNPLAIRLVDFAKQCLHALSANNMVNHMELFVTQQNEIIFLEVSARPPGALVNLTHAINFGINLMDEDLYLQSGLDISLEKKPATEKAFFALFPLRPGTIKQRIAPITKSRCEMSWFANPGQIVDVNDCKDIVNKAAYGVFYHKDPAVLQKDFETVKNHQALIMA